MEYVPYREIAARLDIHPGDVVHIASDIRLLMLAARRNGEAFEPDRFIETFCEQTTAAGTVMFPTYTWDFCRGLPFDYLKTPGQVGSLGNRALALPGFRRTRHPIYSFAVWGKDRDFLCGLDNRMAFGPETPFQYLFDAGALAFGIGISWNAAYTYVHHVEQVSGKSPNRYHKDFTGKYLDEHGEESLRTYSMFVRKLEMGLNTDPDKLGNLVDSVHPPRMWNINGVAISRMDVRASTGPILEDMVNNGGRNLLGPER